MISTSHDRPFYFDGVPLYVHEVVQSLGDIYPSVTNHFVKGPSPDYATVRCSIRGWGHEVDIYYQRIHELSSWRENNICALGSGRICPYCGDYNPAATTICWRCKGETEEIKFATPRQAKISITLLQGMIRPHLRLDDGEDMLRTLDIELMVRTGDDSVLTHLLTGSARLLPTSFSLNTGFYLCQYCGKLVTEESICSFCGGQRLPWMEVLHLKRECIYCGDKVTGGIICPGCAATISGITFRQWKEAQ